MPRKPLNTDDDDYSPATPTMEESRLDAMLSVTRGLKSWRPAKQVLVPVTSVPTIFAQYNRATRVCGHPLERFGIVHGPSSHGKTIFLHGLGLSFLKLGHFYAFIDAEYTTPEDWLQSLMAEYSDHPGFIALRPRTYEETVDAVRAFVKSIESGRTAKENPLPRDMTALIVVDSIKKLVPEDILTKVNRFGAAGEKGSIDGMGGRGGQIQAALNDAWLKELTPLLAHTKTTMMAVARESQEEDGYKVGGGNSLLYDSSLAIRITRESYVKDGSGDNAVIVGERHKIAIHKTKIAGKTDKATICYFHTSNGVMVPAGFDRARDILELAKEYDIVAKSGSWLTWRDCRWQGDSLAVKRLSASPEALAKIEADVVARFRSDEELPTEDGHEAF